MAETRHDPPAEPTPSRRFAERDEAPDSDMPSGTHFDGEDFLFHLYRGSELLQDNCIEQAKEELERALALQPRDVEGQGLLGVVYFRLGLYPRSIEIYEEIVHACPGEVTPRLNLALCYLKTGQHERARELLEEVTRRVPDHKRAWGYLGLCFERIGDYTKALASFERAEQPHLARRMQQRLEVSAEPGARNTESSRPERAEVRQAAADAVQELEGVDDSGPFARADDQEQDPSRSGRWRAVEPGMPPLGAPPATSLAARIGVAVPPAEERRVSERPPLVAKLPTPSALAAGALVDLGGGAARSVGDNAALVRIESGFIVRLEAVRALSPDGAAFESTTAYRRQRGRDTGEPLGSLGATLCKMAGSGAALLRARTGRSVVMVELGGETLYLRESVVLGFSDSARYESGRLATGAGDQIAMLMLAGSGIAVVELAGIFRAVSVSVERSVALCVDDVAGWTGRLLPQPLAPEQAPGRAHGFVTFSGDGAVWLEGG